ncbi:Gfo/Idh/MocA family protein [Loigolactobacillus zhaoyuanensis]|uniref:Gfo/Idh/MocA family protein n=1 Tax=Loigolactobacillus zhaoyuanensis TaxID=2486017 RepID=A0ABW8UIT3_9LACO|nr:Gfo/Idh/MocA family oxidoreductase [Loigolactobacillus zhaoyuanensis]
MLKLGIIGTNWITEQFVEAALATGNYQLTTVYSRSQAKAQTFADKFQVTETFTDLDRFFAAGQFEVVYIASPNSLHFEHAKLAIAADKHVIVEKPAFSNPSEMANITALLSNKPNLFLFEAARHAHEPNFKAVQKAVGQLDRLQGAVLTYMKYSSRYDQVLAGKEPNVFSPRFSGGALQDLGVYVVYDAVAWFGVPEAMHYYASLLPTGVDGKGTAILRYTDFDVTLIIGKNATSNLPSEIYGLHETLELGDNAADLQTVNLQRGTETKLLSTPPAANPMIHEAEDFHRMITENDRTAATENMQLSQQVNQVLYDLRRSAGIVFAADIEEQKNNGQ